MNSYKYLQLQSTITEVCHNCQGSPNYTHINRTVGTFTQQLGGAHSSSAKPLQADSDEAASLLGRAALKKRQRHNGNS